MGVSRTKTVKNKHSTKSAGISGSKSARSSKSDGVVKSKKPKGKAPSLQVKGRQSIADLLKKKKKKAYTAEQLGVPKLNMITPVGVEKPKGKKKGKVFVDDPESMSTILAMVQAEKEGQIESKMMKARQMEEIREARRAEAEKKEQERKAKLDETKESLRKKRKRNNDTNDDKVRDVAVTGSKAIKPRKKVAFA